MILFNLICSQEHEFEGWFRDGEAYEQQSSSGALSCPVCNDHAVRKAIMAPSVVSSRQSVASAAKEAQQILTALREHVESSAENVGERFPEEARRIHYGETEKRAIFGDASPEEATALREEGIEFVSIPWQTRRDS